MTPREWFPVSSQRLRFSATGLICLVREYFLTTNTLAQLGSPFGSYSIPCFMTLGAWRGRADRIVCFSGFIPAFAGGESSVMCKIVDLCFPVQFLFPLPILQPFPAVWLSVCCGAATTVRPRRTLSFTRNYNL